MSAQYDGLMNPTRPSAESAFTEPSSICPRVDLWSAPDCMSSECEVTEFLYALVRLLKPAIVVETGCFLGATSVAIGRALKINRHGRLLTCDLDAALVAQVRKVVSGLGLAVEVRHCASMTLIAKVPQVDLAFVDSGANRVQEIRSLAPRISRFGIIALHDTAPHQCQFGSRHFESNGLQGMYMNTPRGLTLFQRRVR
jgi:predicted O-methyltransferase YrrM